MIWLAFLVVLVTGLAIVLQQLPARRVSRMIRFLYYIPGALAGAASVMVWLFMLDPDRQPGRAAADGCSATARSGRSSSPGT